MGRYQDFLIGTPNSEAVQGREQSPDLLQLVQIVLRIWLLSCDYLTHEDAKAVDINHCSVWNVCSFGSV